VKSNKHKKTEKKLVFIISSSHSGSTLLDMILGAHSEIFSLGEIINFPRAAKSTTIPCVCGVSVSKCKFWAPIIEDLSYDMININDRIEIKLSKQEKLKLLIPFYHFTITKNIDIDRNFEILRDLYNLVYAKSKCNILVDSSKYWGRPIYLKKMLKSYSIYVLHIVRDGRGVLNSGIKRKNKVKQYTENSYTSELEYENNIINNWMKTNLFSSIMLKNIFKRKYMLVKYENICNNPYRVLKNISNLLNIEFENKMVNFGDQIHHNIGGNHMRLDKNLFIKKVDDEWKIKLVKNQLKLFNRKAKWLNKFYGY